MRKRLLSLFLVLCMVSTMLPSTAFAAGSIVAVSGISSVAGSGKAPVCESHKQHGENCGYIAAEEAQLCSHLLTDGTYRCAPSVSGNAATPSDADEDYACPHDDGCGFAEAVEGAPCTHACELCAEPDGTEESEVSPDDDVTMPDKGEPEQEDCICEHRCTEDTINRDCPACTAEDADLTVVCGGRPMDGNFPDKKNRVIITAFETLGEPFTETAPGVYVLEAELTELPLPDTLGATGYAIRADMSITDTASPSDAALGSAPAAVTIAITWESEPVYDPDMEPGTKFTFSARWDTENYPLGEGVQSPVVTVMLTAPKRMMSSFSTGKLTRGNTYYFDLSDEAGNIGTINPAVPDVTLCYVPFTYTGNFQAKKYTSENSSFDFATCDRFVADYNVSTNVSWNDLNDKGLIFGKTFDSSFQLRSLSASEAKGGYGSTPEDGQNEWDRILYYAGVSGWGNGAEWIKNYDEISSWAQDAGYFQGTKTLRGWGDDAKRFFAAKPDTVNGSYGWRPAIEITDTANVSVITLDLNGGALNGAEEINLVHGGENLTAPGSTGLTQPSDHSGSYFKWNTQADGKGMDYEVGANIPKSVTALYARWQEPVQPLIFTDSASDDIPDSMAGTAIAPIDVRGGVSGGTTPYVFSAAGLPAGITVSANGTISGTPTGISNAGTAEITVTDSTKPTAQTAAITIAFGTIQKGAGPFAPDVTFSFDGANANKLAGATAAMEYRLDGGTGETDWISCTADTDLTASLDSITAEHDIKIRIKETAAYFAGEAQTIDITQAGEPDLTATQPSMIGGKGSIPMTAAHEYSTDKSAWTAATGPTSLAAGTYSVRVQAAGTALASPSQTITLIAFTGTPELTPTAVFTAAGEKDGTLTDVTAGMKYSVDGGTDWTIIAGSNIQITDVTAANGIKVIMPGNGTTTTDSEVQSITVTQADTPDLTATQPSMIGGKGSIPMTAAHEYSTDKSAWTAAAGPTSLAAGTYSVRVQAAGTALASPSQAITLIAFTGTPEPTPKAVFTAAGEKDGTLTNVTAGMTYQIDQGTPLTISDTSVFLTELSPCTIVVVKKGNGLTTTDSKAQAIKVTTAGAVSGVSATNCTNSNNNNGTLIGVTTAMEYQKLYASTWIDGTGSTIEGLASGTYQVRIKAADTVLAGTSSRFTVSPIASHSVTYALTNVSKTGADSITDGQSLSITLQAAVSYKLPETITVTMGGTVLSADNGCIYNNTTGTIEITNVTGAVVITAVGVADTPSGTGPTITTTSLPDGIVGTAYSQNLVAIGDIPITWSLDSSSLPGGLALSSSTGVISGVPTTAGTFTFTVEAVNSADNDTKAFTIAIAAAGSSHADKTALYAAVQNAENIMGNTVISVQNGTDVSAGTYWVRPDIMRAAKTALAEANKAADNPNAAQVEIDNAVVKLNAKINIDFKAAKKLGTKSHHNGESSSGGGSYTPPSVVPPSADCAHIPAMAETDVTAEVDSKGEGTVTISADTAADSITKAQNTAKKNGGEANGIAVQINVTTRGKTANAITVNLPKATQERLITAKVSNCIIAVDSPRITVSLDLDAVKSINTQAKADVQISAVEIDPTNLSAEAKAAIGSRPAFDLKAAYAGGAQSVDSFGAGNVTVAIPYTLQSGETAGGVCAIYVDGNGEVRCLANFSYDTDAKILRFGTNHFSVYGVGYKAPAAFTDIANHWAKTDIAFAVNRGLISGTGKTTFAPDSSMTRGMFVTALGRLAGVEVNGYTTSKFTDVDAKAYYALYVNWAAEKGIANGISNTTFAPDQLINREQMAVMMRNYAKTMGHKVPETRAAMTFTDNGSIGTWAAAAVKQMQMAGVIGGKDGDRFDPQGTATRAEGSAVLHRYAELIDPATAQGWTRNETGHWYYFKNGKKFIGWQTIDGLCYYFNADGSMAVNTNVDGYKIGADGIKKEK